MISCFRVKGGEESDTGNTCCAETGQDSFECVISGRMPELAKEPPFPQPAPDQDTGVDSRTVSYSQSVSGVRSKLRKKLGNKLFYFYFYFFRLGLGAISLTWDTPE